MQLSCPSPRAAKTLTTSGNQAPAITSVKYSGGKVRAHRGAENAQFDTSCSSNSRCLSKQIGAAKESSAVRKLYFKKMEG